MSHIEDVGKLETSEYQAAMERLVENADFRAVLVQQYVETQPSEPHPLQADYIPAFNFNQGAHSWVHSLVSWMKVNKPATYFNFIQETMAYEYRRRDAHRRDNESK